MPDYDLVIRGRRVVTPDGERPVAVGVRRGRIAAVLHAAAPVTARSELVIADDEVLLPGLVDTHVHVNEPGRTDWEGFASATRAAAAGGVTTLLDMPLNSVPPTIDGEALAVKRAAAAGQCHVDVGFWGGAVPGNIEQLRPLHEAGVYGFKCFLADSGVTEFPHVDEHVLADTVREVTAFGALLLAHAEDQAVLDRYKAPRRPATRGSYAAFLASRPAEAEEVAVRQLIALAAATGARVHIVHLSSAGAVPALAAARRDGVRVTAETCPHYLTLCAEEVPDGATAYKCCPPIRDTANRERLWQALADGTIDMIVSDHSPCPAELKELGAGDFDAAWGGIASLQLGLPAVWTEARRRGRTLADVSHWMATRPAAIAGLSDKGRIVVGADADLCVFAPDEEWLVDAGGLHHRHPVTPYHGMRLTGVVRATWLRGVAVDGMIVGGRLISREGG